MENKNIYYVYRHITSDTKELFYIGKGKDRRAYETKRGRNKFWHNITEKHGYIIEFIKTNLTEEESLNLEKEEIEKYKPRANLSIGGRGGATGYKHTQESLNRRSATQSRLKSTPEARLKNSIIQKEVQSRPEVKAKIKIGVLNYWEKVRKGEIKHPFKGKYVSLETRKKLSESQKGEKAYWYGKTTAMAKKIIDLDSKEIFPSLRKAAESVNGQYRCLLQSLKKNRPYKKKRFAYYE